jgi:hypothetical protein
MVGRPIDPCGCFSSHTLSRNRWFKIPATASPMRTRVVPTPILSSPSRAPARRGLRRRPRTGILVRTEPNLSSSFGRVLSVNFPAAARGLECNERRPPVRAARCPVRTGAHPGAVAAAAGRQRSHGKDEQQHEPTGHDMRPHNDLHHWTKRDRAGPDRETSRRLQTQELAATAPDGGPKRVRNFDGIRAGEQLGENAKPRIW